MQTRTEKLREIAALGWTKEEQHKIGEAFCLIDEVIRECIDKDEENKVNELARVQWELHELVTAFGIDRIIKGLPGGGGFEYRNSH